MKNIKIAFDRSAFHGERYEKIINSKFTKFVENHILLVYHTPIFLEETLSLFQKEKNRSILRDQLPFIIHLKSKWFKRREELILDELLNSYTHKSFEYITRQECNIIKLNMKKFFIDNDIPSSKKEELLNEKIFEKNLAMNNRELFKEIREKFSSDFSKDKKKGETSEDAFLDWFLVTHSDDMAKHLIDKYLTGKTDLTSVFNTWRENKRQYKYFSQYVKGMLYCLAYPLIYPNESIDTNSTYDIDQLSYLRKIDYFISEDQGFMKNAFYFLYKNTSKKYLTVDRFLEIIDLID